MENSLITKKGQAPSKSKFFISNTFPSLSPSDGMAVVRPSEFSPLKEQQQQNTYTQTDPTDVVGCLPYVSASPLVGAGQSCRTGWNENVCFAVVAASVRERTSLLLPVAAKSKNEPSHRLSDCARGPRVPLSRATEEAMALLEKLHSWLCVH